MLSFCYVQFSHSLLAFSLLYSPFWISCPFDVLVSLILRLFFMLLRFRSDPVYILSRFGSEFVKKAVIRTRICIAGPEGKISAVFTHKKLSNSHKKLIFSHNKSVYLFFYQKELKFRSATMHSDSVIRPRVKLRFRLYEVYSRGRRSKSGIYTVLYI